MAGRLIALTEEEKYKLALQVNVSNFVSVKLSSQSNYEAWKAQMLCLLETMKLVDTIDDVVPWSRDRIQLYDTIVKGWIFSSMDERILPKFIKLGSSLQVWRQLESLFDPSSITERGAISTGFVFRSTYVRVPEIADRDIIELKKKLYETTVEGCWWKTKALLKNHKDADEVAIMEISENGNTMLHQAVQMGHNYFVEQLLKFIKDKDKVKSKDINGRTALHVAAMVGNVYAARLLLLKNRKLLSMLDYKAQSALDIACTNKRLNTYVYLLELRWQPSRLDRYPRSYYKNLENLIISAILTKQYQSASKLLEKYRYFAMESDQILMAITKTFPIDLGFMGSLIYPSLWNVGHKIALRGSLIFHDNVLYKYAEDIIQIVKTWEDTWCGWLGKYSMILLIVVAILYPIYDVICLLILLLRIPLSTLYFLVWKVLAIIVTPIKNVEKKKQNYDEAKEILSLICDQMGAFNSAYTQPILEAVRQDAYEVVDEILFRSPDTINCQDEEGHNVIQLTIKSRSEKVYNLIYHIIEHTDSYKTMRDSSKNNLLHLAVMLAPASVLGRITGAALQLQRELQWCKEVKKFLLPSQQLEENMYMETPEVLFNSEHEDLMKRGESWIKTTAESCSITAALIITVVFAAAITVPGGSNQETGIPVFRSDIAFTIFAVSNALSLITAATALLLFLSILTTRFSQRDFLVVLPIRLIFGLLSLFLATSATIVTFGAVLYLVFCDQRPWMLAPIVGPVSLPIFVIVFIKLPLLMDLFRSTYFPIFGKQSYIDGCKTKLINTIFLR